jgi:carboxymethylenebutenolidase
MSSGRDFTLDAGTGRTLTAFLAEPAGIGADAGAITGTLSPAVIVVHEIMGLNDDIRRIASRFADSGYVALAPDLIGAGWPVLCIARFFQGMGKVGTGRPYLEMDAFHDWLARQPGVDPDRVGMAGFCAGGGFALLYAARGGRKLRAIAPFYGAMPADESVIPDVCPTVASFGGRDGFFGKNGPKLEAALEAAGIPHDVKTYPDAGHSFMSQHTGLMGAISPRTPMHARFDEPASEDAWARVLAFFGEHLAAEPATARDQADPVDPA